MQNYFQIGVDFQIFLLKNGRNVSKILAKELIMVVTSSTKLTCELSGRSLA